MALHKYPCFGEIVASPLDDLHTTLCNRCGHIIAPPRRHDEGIDPAENIAECAGRFSFIEDRDAFICVNPQCIRTIDLVDLPDFVPNEDRPEETLQLSFLI